MSDDATHITLGAGICDIGPINYGDKTAVLIRPRANHVPFGQQGELQNTEYVPVKGDVVIWSKGEGSSVLIKELLANGVSQPPDKASIIAILNARLDWHDNQATMHDATDDAEGAKHHEKEMKQYQAAIKALS